MEKIKTGIPGLDKLLKGGINHNNSILVTGAPGTGKSVFGMQFLYQGLKNNEKCLYITAEEDAENLRKNMKSIGLDLSEYEKKGLLVIYDQQEEAKIMTLEKPLGIIKKNKIKRVVLDSLTLLKYIYADHELTFRKGVLRFIRRMKEEGTLFLATAEKETTDLDDFRYEMQDFLFDGLIILTKVRKGASFERLLSVAKMRGQAHLIDVFPFSIETGGIKVFSEQLPFSLIEKDIFKKEKNG